MAENLYFPAVMPSEEVLALAREVRLLILDVDGVMTTGYLDYDANGEVVKSFYVHDGLGIQLLRQVGIPIAIISGRNSKVTAARAKDLKIDFLYQGAQDKGLALSQLMQEAHVTPQQCAYIGDDVIDLPILRAVGFAASVPNGHVLAQRAAHWVSNNSGGMGAVREIAELILFAQDKLSLAYDAYLNDEHTPKLDIM
ncbi:KdsC family phosphatase [Hydromonas duriensis]|uniref:3-deoxy-D-manno-octulosonate 8-phosphate phosphatase KdsC n=1 Tax=Hydromonas duriensis TaxID=1527608 RepID=A0A4R6Y2P6_9BURK|nr:HAD-IIIA family hydrolase [Hydromonas duriensis]TDR30811.1 3-deoxy-D-manno-octulosonate 8-phosphate phosphatase (KDO 8-P phosphatase) [Hydromonas duriensis]